ncbi:MerR family transcriptional regulator [Streptomyces sp. NPDC005385]|uniref:MerR family transcriptional regulator n=1 Tax=Streptomyces sp. NPDC005385 TaxID=3157039 RepID=UPI0033B0D4FA
MRIGDAAAVAGTTARALRFYEERGLLPTPRRTAAGQREYGPGEVARIKVIRDLLALGLTVEDLCRLADRIPLLVDDPRRECSGDTQSPGAGVVHRRLAALDKEISRLSTLRTRLAAQTGHTTD